MTTIMILFLLTCGLVTLSSIITVITARRITRQAQRNAEQGARNLLWMQRTLAGKKASE